MASRKLSLTILIVAVLIVSISAIAMIPSSHAAISQASLSGPSSAVPKQWATLKVTGSVSMNVLSTEMRSFGTYNIVAQIYAKGFFGDKSVTRCSTNAYVTAAQPSSSFGCVVDVMPSTDQSWGSATYYGKVTAQMSGGTPSTMNTNSITIKCIKC